MQEIWKDIVGYEGLYQVSNLGRVKVLPKTIHYGWYNNKVVNQEEMIKKNTLRNKSGYYFTTLTKDKVRHFFQIHRLVAEAFLPNPNNYECVNHKDENKTNNNVDNLEWCTRKYNANYGSRNKKISLSMTGEKNYHHKKVKCLETGVIYNGSYEAERKTGIKHYNIRKCANGLVESVNGLHWIYI